MDRLLVTGFAPFGGSVSNPSGAIARALDGTLLQPARPTDGSGTMLHGRVLPVVYGEAAALVLAAVQDMQPRAVLMLGLSARARGLRLERQAHAQCSATARDTSGARAPPAAGPAVLRTVLDVDRLVAGLTAHGIAAAASEDAGGYVCNHTYHQVLAAQDRAPALPVLFVHLPWPAGCGPRTPLDWAGPEAAGLAEAGLAEAVGQIRQLASLL